MRTHIFRVMFVVFVCLAVASGVGGCSCADDPSDNSGPVDDTGALPRIDDDVSDDTDDDIGDDDIDDDANDDDDSNDDDAFDDDDSNDDDADDDTVDDDAVAEAFTLVELPDAASPAMKIAVQACSGLSNRNLGGSIFVRMKDKDDEWLVDLGLVPEETIGAEKFLASCVAKVGACVRYSYDTQQKIVPNILTAGAALGAVPLDDSLPVTCVDPVFDAIAEFASRDTPYLATKYVYENFVDDTTGLAMMNPGYDQNDKRYWDPALTGDVNASLVDFVFSEKLFVIFLVNGCFESGEEGALLSEIVVENPWLRPIGVFGYNDSWLVFGGYLFEAHTRCTDAGNMGAIPTSFTNNLSFYSRRRAPIENVGEVEQNPPEDIAYDPAKTYVAFIIGDGDNVSYIMDARSRWLAERLADCEKPDNSCEPITWSISPHLTRIAPDILEWYYAMSRQTGKDYFTLPPSGHLYAYPASMPGDMQEAFVAATENDARLLDITGTVHWDWATTWRDAETVFLPKYAEHGVIEGVFPVNVPYMFPTFTWPNPDQFFKVLPGAGGGEVVLFRPREWRGVDNSGSGLTAPFFLSPENMADELAHYPPGTVTAIYMTSDGGLNLTNSFMALVKLLPAHVRLVSTETAARLALEAHRMRADR